MHKTALPRKICGATLSSQLACLLLLAGVAHAACEVEPGHSDAKLSAAGQKARDAYVSDV